VHFAGIHGVEEKDGGISSQKPFITGRLGVVSRGEKRRKNSSQEGGGREGEGRDKKKKTEELFQGKNFEV